MKRFNVVFVVIMLLFVGGFVRTANGFGFVDSYEMQNWSATASNGGTTTITPNSGSATSATFGYDINLGGGGVPFRTWTFGTMAADTGLVTFDWAYDFHHAWFNVGAVFQAFAETSSGTTITSLVDFHNFTFTGAQHFDSTLAGGPAVINVERGYRFGFILGGSNYDSNSFLQGTLTVSNFNAPVPEPSTIMLIGLGLIGLFGVRWKTILKK